MRFKNQHFIDESIKRIPLQATATVSIAASGSDSATISVPSDEMFFIKSITVTKGTNVTVSSIMVDSNDTYVTADVADTVSRYGALINAETSVVISGSNAGAGAENLDIQIDGYKLSF